MTTPNRVLLKQTLEYIETHPDEWDQSRWITPPRYRSRPGCGTAYCYAGWAVKLAGYEVDPLGDIGIEQLGPDLIQCLDTRDLLFTYPSDGRRVVETGDLAAILLEIPVWDDCPDCAGGDHHPFCVSNTLDDLRRRVAELCGETEQAVS